MVNTCEPLINFVKAKQAKVADRLEPKGVQLDTPLQRWGYTDIRLPEKRRNLTYHVNLVEHGKPVFLPIGQADRKGSCWECGYGIAEKANATL